MTLRGSLTISDDNIEILTQSFFNKGKTVYPYRELNEIIFSKAFIGYKVAVPWGRTKLTH